MLRLRFHRAHRPQLHGRGQAEGVESQRPRPLVANSPGFVAAVVWAIEQQEDLSRVNGVPEEFSEEVLALASCEDEQGYQTLAALAGIELVEGDGLPLAGDDE